MSLRVVATITAQPGHEQEVGDALGRLAAGTRTENGCVSYELFRSSADATVFVTVEEWEDQADLDDHMRGPHVTEALATVGEKLAATPAIHPLIPLS